MRKEQLVRICLAMLLASTTLLLSFSKKDKGPKDKDPKEALVNTRWQETTDCLEVDPDDEVADVSGELRFTSQTEGELTSGDKEVIKLNYLLTYSYDTVQKAYPVTMKLDGTFIGIPPKHCIMKVNWDTNTLKFYELEDGVVSSRVAMCFRLVK